MREGWIVADEYILIHTLKKTELYRRKATPLHEDNQGALPLADNSVFHPRTKHINVRYHAILEPKQNKETEPVYCPADKMIADDLTKPLERFRLRKLVEELRLEGKC